MQPRSKPPLVALAIGLLTVAVALLAARKIDLLTADLGRHLANGRWLLDHPELLSTNFYSQDFASTPFVNHHWLSGLVFHLLAGIGGFPALSLLYLALIGSAYVLMALLAVRRGGAALGLTLSLLVLPLVSFRTEVRPEGFSFLLMAVFLWILSEYRSGRYGPNPLYVLPALVVLWVNLHIYFIFGLAMIALFFAEAVLRSKLPRLATAEAQGASRTLGIVLGVSLAAALINPFGARLALYPLQIFDNYGYLIVENQSVWFLTGLGVHFPVFPPLYTAVALLWLGAGSAALRQGAKLPLASLVLAAGLSLMALCGIRNIALFGLMALPVLAESWRLNRRRLSLALLIPLSCGAVGLFLARVAPQLGPRFGIGLEDLEHRSATFFKTNGLKGPIFNNYDIGGYLIYHLYPEVRPFVDNRPEAYPAGFFKDLYVPMQEDAAKWRAEVEARQFNAIYYYWHDMTPAAQSFLLARVQDPDWVPVYVDDAALIFVRQTPANAGIIERYAIPRERFAARPGG